MRLRIPLLVVAILAMVTGCNAATDLLSPGELRALNAARARWAASPLRAAYVYEVRQSCFCPPEVTQWHRVRVIDGVITEVRSLAGDPVPASQRSWYYTVDSLFAILQRERSDYLQDITATYDATHGYPLTISLISKPEIADGGGAWFTRNLQPAPVP